jgi:ribosome maturation factor RimP
MNITIEKLKNLIEPVITQKNFEIYDIEYKKEGKGWVLRVFADNKTKNISLDECAEISHSLSEVLDQNEELNLHDYSLEVSSPGLDRLLRNEGDFNWAKGKTLKVKFTNDQNKKDVVEGKLEKVLSDKIELSLPKKGSGNVTIKLDNIESARRVMKFDELLPKEPK